MAQPQNGLITPVAIALVAHNGCYLVGRRGPDQPLSGYYEFPGGKCRPGESPVECAVRECFEETGLRVEVVRLRRAFVHTYPYGRVHLHFFDCRVLTDSESFQPHRGFIWLPREQLPDHRFPEANQSLLAELAAEAGG